MADKAPYNLKYNLEAWNVDRMHTALAKLREIAGEYELASAFKVSLKIESDKDENLRAIYEQFEAWLHSPDGGGVDGRALLDLPVARPTKRPPPPTPMDAMWSEDDEGRGEEEAGLMAAVAEHEAEQLRLGNVVRMLVRPPLLLNAPDDVVDGEAVITEG
jgi:hypothetical protein